MSFDRLITDYDESIFYFILCCFTSFSTAYIFCKSLGVRIKKTKIVYLLLFGIILSFLYFLLKKYNNQLSNLFLFLLIPMVVSRISDDKPIVSLNVGLLSLSFFQIIKIPTSILVASFFWLIGYTQKDLLVYGVILIVASLLCVLFMKIKRFQNGFQVFENEKNIGLGLALSSVVFIITCIDLNENSDKDIVFIIVILGVLLFGFGLYLWIRRSITAHYRERLQLKSEEHYKEILEKRKKEIEKLTQSNEYLAKIVHRDNHLMYALDASVDAYFNSTNETDKDTLLRELQTLAKERGELIAREQLDSKLLPTVGNHLIDGAINDLYVKAAAHGIDFNLTVSSTVDEIIGKYISQTDLQTLLSDHIKDAIIAVESRGEAGGKILVNLSMQKENYVIDIYDNGVEFDIETLSKLGLERVTTHSDTGGSGIGFMTTFETLNKAYASLVITEFENKTPFSKSVTFRFDGENAYIIHSYRSEELKKNINRADLVIDN